MAKNGRGGRRTGGIRLTISGSSQPQAQQQAQQPQPQPQPQPAQTQTGGNSATFAQFLQMSDAQQAQIIKQASQTGVPVFLDNTGLQQFAFAVGGYGKPDVVSDAQLDKMPGIDLYRTVNGYKNRSIGTNYTAQEIADQVLYADYTVYNSGGGMAYGNGLYFADSYTDSAGYGDYYPRSGKPDIRMVRAKVTGKIIGSSSLKSKFRADNSQMAKQIRSSGWSGSEQMAVYAIAKGYTAIQHGSYYTIVNRSGLAFSNRVKDNSDYTKIGHKW